jgi:hypothetical protein
MDWAIGIFEGEGCINIRPPAPRRPNPTVRLAVSMTDRDVVERFARIVECGNVTKRDSPSIRQWKPTWVWKTADRDEVHRLLEIWLPQLGERRAAKAREALAVLDEIEVKRQRVCEWGGEPFRAERMTKRFCCEAHRAAAKYLERRVAAKGA